LIGADLLVAKTLEIIMYFDDALWMIENPQTGLLKSRAVVKGLPWTDVSYCRYGTLYQKHTRLWHNLAEWFDPLPPCSAKTPCMSKAATGKHPRCAQRGHIGTGRGGFTLDELHAIPQPLCDYIAETVDIIVSNKECDAVIREAVVCEEEAAALAAAAESAATKNGEADSANVRRSCGGS